MSSREIFLRGELKNIYNVLSVCYDYTPYSQLDDDKRFNEITKLLIEIKKKSDLLCGSVRGFF